MTPEIKRLAGDLIDEHRDFEYDDAVSFCDHALRHLGLCYFEYVDALQYIMVGIDCEQEGI